MSGMDDEKGPQEEAPENVAIGELLYCGGTNWDSMGRKTSVPAGVNLVSPTRLRPLIGVDIRFVASGCTSCHCLALDVEGRCYTWGRNEKGQLGHGNTLQRSLPTIVSQLSKYKIVTAGAGRNHTVVVTDDGKSYSFGWNKHGQLGSGSLRNEIEPSPVLCQVSQVTNAVCGADFTVWLSSVEGSSILTAGLPQYGQLGHGTDNEYNVKDSSVKLAYEAQPRPRAIAAFAQNTVVKVACGTNHTVAVDSSGFVYTWGFGGYGRLGHREQKDEWVPRLVEVFQKRNVLPPNAVVSAGSVNSACTAGGGQLYMWGKLKTTGDDWMYPKPVMDLSGWNIRCMDSGNMHHVIGADDACISWGHAQYGSLVMALLDQSPLLTQKSRNTRSHACHEDDFSVLYNEIFIENFCSVACGLGLSLIVVDRAKAGDRLEQLEIYEGDAAAQGDEGQDEPVATEKKTPRKAAGNSSTNSRKRKNKDSSAESEDVEDEYEDSEEDSNEDSDDENGDLNSASRGGKSSGRGRGRGAKKTATETKNAGRGRGRPKKTDKSIGQHEAANAGSGRRGRGRPRKNNR